MLRLRSLIKNPDRLMVHRKSHQNHFHYAYEFSTQILAYLLDSLVRVSKTGRLKPFCQHPKR
eukprot:jgi/Orpsp1_1/1190024/evm.model.d7180000076194.1